MKISIWKGALLYSLNGKQHKAALRMHATYAYRFLATDRSKIRKDVPCEVLRNDQSIGRRHCR